MSDNTTTTKDAPVGVIRGWWDWFWRPTQAAALGVLLMLGFAGGIVFWGGFNWSMEATNTEQFCISCHEMKTNVFVEYQKTIHYSNRSGVRASCPDCHVPKDWGHKMIRKIQASNELWHHFFGSVDTPEKFNAKRLQLATNEWKRMKSTDSRECRNCHKFDYMDYSLQETRASKTHQEALTAGKTCIDCHRGIAHTLPPNAHETYQKLVDGMQKSELKNLSDYAGGLVGPAHAQSKPAAN